MTHSPEHNRQKHEAREKAKEHMDHDVLGNEARSHGNFVSQHQDELRGKGMYGQTERQEARENGHVTHMGESN
jgi:hypothetical protein